jgi:hypothetical protein
VKEHIVQGLPQELVDRVLERATRLSTIEPLLVGGRGIGRAEWRGSATTFVVEPVQPGDTTVRIGVVNANVAYVAAQLQAQQLRELAVALLVRADFVDTASTAAVRVVDADPPREGLVSAVTATLGALAEDTGPDDVAPDEILVHEYVIHLRDTGRLGYLAASDEWSDGAMPLPAVLQDAAHDLWRNGQTGNGDLTPEDPS